jgi:uncharacterized protein (DUF1810 family)
MTFWKFYIFPQITNDLKHTDKDTTYFIKNDEEAVWYMQNQTLRDRYFNVVDIIYNKLVETRPTIYPFIYMGRNELNVVVLWLSLKLFSRILGNHYTIFQIPSTNVTSINCLTSHIDKINAILGVLTTELQKTRYIKYNLTLS